MVPAETETLLKVFFFLENEGKETVLTFHGKTLLKTLQLYGIYPQQHIVLCLLFRDSNVPLYDSAAFIRII